MAWGIPAQTHHGQNRLERVSDDTGLRYLAIEYNPQGQLSVSDHTGREVTFGYDPAGDLTSATDLMEQTTSYTYDNAHHLRLVTELPTSTNLIHTEYDFEGRAYQQYAPDGTLVLEITYDEDGVTTYTDAFQNTATHYYNARNVLGAESPGEGIQSGKLYDGNFRPALISDPNGNGPMLNWSDDGANLTRIIDAQGNRTDMVYDNNNHLTEVIDPKGYLTSYEYDGNQLLSITDAYSATTLYTYTTAADYPQPSGLLKESGDPLGRVTRYTYDQYGQRTSVTTVGMSGADDRTTYYAYDELGRLQTVTDPEGRSNWMCYDAAGRVIRSVSNASGDGSTPQTDPCDVVNYQPNADEFFIASALPSMMMVEK